MTKKELLLDLEGRLFVESLLGAPINETPKNDMRKWYRQPYMEVQGKVGLKKNCWFYVANEGEAGEAAYYKDEEPTPTTRRTEFSEWLAYQLYVLSISAAIKSWVVVRISEDINHALVAVLVPNTSGSLDLAGRLARKADDGKLILEALNISSSDLIRAITPKL